MTLGRPIRQPLRVGLAALTAAALAVVVPSVAARGATVTPTFTFSGVPLPPAWEICVLAGLHAPLTAANVADLDLWQIAEGGSTDNSNAYNPFNTKRAHDVAGAPLAMTLTSIGFPAFANWPAGCAATVATILQPNMAPIAAALQAGSARSPAAFLAVVDATPWCAPDNGVPCYSDLISEGAEPATSSAAMPLYNGTAASVAAYDGQVAQAAAIAMQLVADEHTLASDDEAVAAAQQAVQAALDRLRSLAVYEYTSNTSINHELNLKGFETPDVKEELTQYYEHLNADQQAGLYDEAKTAVVQAQARRDEAAAVVAQTSASLSSAQAVVAHTARDFQREAQGFLTAGACASFLPSGLAGAPLASGLRACLSSLA
jgi:hypothetical protein